MLRITPLCREAEKTVLKVEGRIAGRDADLLDRELSCAFRETPCVVLDVDGIRFVDRLGIEVLQRWSEKHLVFRGGSAFVRVVLETYGLNGRQEGDDQ